MREIDVAFDPERKLFLYFGIALLAIGVGPFGTYQAMPFWERAVFWTLDILGGLLIIVPILHVFYHSRLVAFIPSIPRFLIGIALGALPASAYISVLYKTVGANLEIFAPFPLLFVEVAVFSTILLLAEFILWPAVFGASEPRPDAPSSAPPVPAAVAEPRTVPLLTRLPPDARGSAIISISMQDHYAEVATTKGKALILMRLGDAIDLLEGWPGARIHRSHWVAKDFVEHIERDGRRMEILLNDGRRLPIGNTYLKAAQQQLDITIQNDPAQDEIPPSA